ncbi:MAG TPA: hypothetical protein ENJ06_00530 [Phycisphaeraceae bacterium]|nr:hypothetical protein [Phycisphaeraceae bacterium]
MSLKSFTTLPGALYELLRLLLLSRFRLRGRYWRWRMETAWGNNPPGKREMLRAILEYARWVRSMRRMS